MSNIGVKLENCIDKQQLLNTSYTLSHLVIASIISAYLKDKKPLVLVVILFAMLGYIGYTEYPIMPLHLLASGTFIYLLDMYIINKNKNNIITTRSILQTLWKIPYWSIISYYIMMMQ